MAITDPWIGFHFSVEIGGIQDAMFSECSGFEAKIEVEEYKEGGLNDYIHKLPGRRSFTTVTLKRGMVSSVELWDWLHRVTTKAQKKDEMKNISIVLRNPKTEEVIRWNLTGAYPIKWTSPAFQADQSAVMLESLELAYQEFTMVKR